jgi:hypothetical protein
MSGLLYVPGVMGTDEPDQPDQEPGWRSQLAAARPYLGWILIAVGGLLLILGYIGVSGETVVSKQLPYLVSGGIGGVFLAIVGACLLVTGDGGAARGRPSAHVDRMVAELHAVLLDRVDADATSDVTVAGNPNVGANEQSKGVVVVEGGETYHRATCAMVSDRPTTVVAPVAASQRGLRPCPVCSPAPSPAG